MGTREKSVNKPQEKTEKGEKKDAKAKSFKKIEGGKTTKNLLLMKVYRRILQLVKRDYQLKGRSPYRFG